jgi:hypothetical protein
MTRKDDVTCDTKQKVPCNNGAYNNAWLRHLSNICPLFIYDEYLHHSDCKRPKEMNDKARRRLRPLSCILNPTVCVCTVRGTDTLRCDWVTTNTVRHVTFTRLRLLVECVYRKNYVKYNKSSSSSYYYYYYYYFRIRPSGQIPIRISLELGIL